MDALSSNLRKVLLLLAFVAVMTVSGCSGSGEEKAAESGVDKMTTDAAKVVVDKIRSPLDAARMTKDLGDKRLEEIDGAMHGE